MKVFVIILSMLVVWSWSCTTPGAVGDDPDDQVVILTQPDTEVEVTTDGGTTTVGRSHAEMSLCSVDVLIYFVEDEAEEVKIVNNNDTAIIIYIENQSTKGLLLQECVRNHGEETHSLVFNKDEPIEIEIDLGLGQVWQTTCAEFIDDIINIFEFCDSADGISFL